MFIHSNVKFLRNYTHQTQAQFGKMFGKSRSNIDSYERGNATPDESIQNDIAKHFNISLETLIHKDLQANPGLLLAGNSAAGNNKIVETDIIKVKDDLIKELRKQIAYLQTQNETLLHKISK